MLSNLPIQFELRVQLINWPTAVIYDFFPNIICYKMLTTSLKEKLDYDVLMLCDLGTQWLLKIWCNGTHTMFKENVDILTFF